MPNERPSPTGPSSRPRSRAVARIQLARRVADAVRGFPAARFLEAVSTDWKVKVDDAEPLDLNPDFAVRFLDTKLQFVLLPGDAAAKVNDAHLEVGVDEMLRRFPEAEACVLVADDEALTSRIIFAGVSEPAIVSYAEASDQGTPAPLTAVIERYLAESDPSWPNVVGSSDSVADFRQIATTAARAAVAERSALRGRIVERQAAREGLGKKDETWAVRMAQKVAAGEALDVSELMAEREPGDSS